MSSDQILPRRVVAYIHEMGVRALDRLASSPEVMATSGPDDAGRDALWSLVQQWHRMTIDQKREFVDQITESVVAVVSASAALPLTLKIEKIAAKATKKVLKREKKKLKKAAKAASKKNDDAGDSKKKKTRSGKSAKKPAAAPAAKPKATSSRKSARKKPVRRTKKPAASRPATVSG